MKKRTPLLRLSETGLRAHLHCALTCLIISAMLFSSLLIPYPTQAKTPKPKRRTEAQDAAPSDVDSASSDSTPYKQKAQGYALDSSSRQSKAHSIGKSITQPQAAPVAANNYGGIIYGYGGFGSGLVMINPDGTNAINLTDAGNSISAFYPSVSPQTGMIAFQGQGLPGFPGSQFSSRIFVMNGDGSGVRELTFPLDPSQAVYSRDYKPRISPDGTKIAFISDRNVGQIHQCSNSTDFAGNPNTTKTGPEVWVVNVDGSNLHQLTTTQYMDNYWGCAASETDAVAWSPDSQQLVVRGYREYDFQVLGGGTSREVPVLALINADGTGGEQIIAWNFQNQKDPVTGLDLERVGTATINTSSNILDWSPSGNILFGADFSNAFFSQFENVNSLGFLPPSVLQPDTTPTYKLTQDLMGQVGFNGSTDGHPHGGRIDDARYGPDGSQILINGYSPRANLPVIFNVAQPALFVNDGDGMIPNTQGANSNNGMAWKPGPAIPQPAQLVLTPNPLQLYTQEVVQEVPTLLDAQGNVIVRSAVWHTSDTGFRCDGTPEEIPCSGNVSFGGNDIDFNGTVTGNIQFSDGTGNLCASNGSLRTCVPYQYSTTATAVVSVKAVKPTAMLSGTGGPGIFTISRDNDPRTLAPKVAVNVNFSVGGTAQRDVDYTLDITGNTVTIPANQDSVNINVRPLGTRGDKTVKLTLQPDAQKTYLISSSNTDTVTIKDDGPSAQSLSLAYITPNVGSDQGIVSPTVFGLNIQQSATVKLSRNGQSDIFGQSVQVASNGSSISAQFNLTGQAQGLWDVVVTNPDNSTARLANAFTIQPKIDPHIWVSLMGRTDIRASHTATTYTVAFGNTGNVDAYAVPLFVVGIPANAEVNLKNVNILPIQGQSPSDALPPIMKTDTSQSIALVLPVVPAGQTNYIQFTLRFSQISTNGSFRLRAVALEPLLELASSSSSSAKPEISSFADHASRASRLSSAGKQVSSAVNPQQSSPTLVVRPRGYEMFYSLLSTAVGCFLGLIPAGDVATCIKDIVGLFVSALSTAGSYSFFGSTASAWSFGSAVHSIAGTLLDCLKATGKVIIEDNAFVFALGLLSCIFSVVDTYITFQNAADLTINTVQSADPNEKVGSFGRTAQHYISGLEPLRYAIYFENQPTATAPAQTVVVTDQLDTTKVDLSTFSLGLISFGGQIVAPTPGQRSFDTDVDQRPAKNLIVRIHAALDAKTGIVTWKFTSIDPTTNQLTTDPTAGFLPPDADGIIGEGNVLFTVQPKAGLADGTQVNNKATITFDLNEAMDTNIFSNTIDDSKPQSQVSQLPATTCNNFTVNWSGTDTGSGIQFYTIYVSEDGAPYTAWLFNTTQTSATFNGQSGKSYSFYSVATDGAGNVEDAPSSPDATTSVNPPAPPVFTFVPPNVTAYTGTSSSCVVFVSDSALGTAVAQESCSSVTVKRSGVPAGNLFPVGTTKITYTATDASGNTTTATQSVTVVDNTPPVISNASLSQSVIWPPNKKMVAITVNYTAADNCDGAVATRISNIMSNEPITASDAVIVDAHHVSLRADRLGSGNGRVYTIVITATDSHGNSASKTLTITVPHDQGG